MKKIAIISLSILILSSCSNRSTKKYVNPAQNMGGISERSTSTENINVPE